MPTRVRYLILILSCSISFVLYLHRYAWGFIKTDMREEFGWDAQDLGRLDGLFTLSYGVAQLPSGMLCDWFGAHLLLGSSVILWSLSLLGFTVAAGMMQMGLWRVTFGVAQASCYPVLNKVSKNWFPISMRTTAQAWIATFFGRGGGAAAFVIIGVLLLGRWQLSWRDALVVLAIVGVVCGIAFVALFRNSPSQHPWSNAAEAHLVTEGDPQAARVTGSTANWPGLLSSVAFWFLLTRGLCSNLADVLFSYWVPHFLRTMKGLSTEEAGWMAALPLVGGALGGLASGIGQSWVIQRTGNRRLARSGAGMIGKLTAALLMLVSLGADSGLAVACIFLLAKFFTDMEQPAEWGAVSDIAGGNAATVFACVNTIGGIGGFVGAELIGSVLKYHDETMAGWNTVFAIIAAEYIVAAACWLFIDPRKVIPDKGSLAP